jgi:hypothetical protein
MSMGRRKLGWPCVGLIVLVCVVGISVGAATQVATWLASSDLQTDWAPAGTTHWDLVNEINGPQYVDDVYTSTPGAIEWYGSGTGEPGGGGPWSVCAAHVLAKKTGTGDATLTVEMYLGYRQIWLPVQTIALTTSWHGYILPWNGEYTYHDLGNGNQIRLTYNGPSTATVHVDEVRVTFAP